MHVEEGVDGKRLHGAQAQRAEAAQDGGSVVAEKVVKLTQNAIFGRCCMNPNKFRNTNAYVDPAKFERAVGKSSVTNFELQINDSEGFLAFVETLKTDRSKTCMSVPTQVGARTLQLSKLMMEKAYYLHIRRLFPKMRLLFTLHAMSEANLNGAALFDVAGKSKDPKRDLSALSAAARAKAIKVMGQLGKLGDETFPARKAVTNVRHLEYQEVLEEGSKRRAAFAQLRSRAPRSPWRPSRRSRSPPSTTRSTASTLSRWGTGATLFSSTRSLAQLALSVDDIVGRHPQAEISVLAISSRSSSSRPAMRAR